MEYVLVNRGTGETILELNEEEVNKIFYKEVKEVSVVKVKYPFIKLGYLKIKDLTPNELKAFLILCSKIQYKTNFIVKNGKPYLKKDLMQDMKTSDQMVRRYFRELEKKNFIKKAKFEKIYWAVNPNLCSKSEFVYKSIIDLFGGIDETRSV